MTINETFRFGDWLVRPSVNSIECNGSKHQMEPRAMDVLVVLCRAAGEIVSADELLDRCWRNIATGDNPLHKTVAQLRRLLGDDANTPVYIETIRKRGYRTVAAVDFLQAEEAAPARWGDGSPFRGLDAFDEQHAPVFFGRSEATRRLTDAATAQVKAGFALQLVLGPSGSGKTSLVRAGLFPALTPALAANSWNDGLALAATTVFDLAEQGEQTLLTALAGALLDLEWKDQPIFPGASAMSLAQRLEHEFASVAHELQAALEDGQDAAAQEAERQETIEAPQQEQQEQQERQSQQERQRLRFGVFIDRLEALFNERIAEQERRTFLNVLEQLARSGTALVVVGCRNDFYPHVAASAMLMESKPNGGHFDLGPPSFSEITQIIRMPAMAAGLRFGVDPQTQARLDDVLCESALASPDALPLLQYCLQELYRLRSVGYGDGNADGGELSFEAFQRLGGIEGALGQRAEQVVAQLCEEHQASLAHVMSLVVVVSANDDSVTSRRAPWSALRSDVERETVEALVASRLFVSDMLGTGDGNTPGFGVAHEAILRRWPRMAEWIATHKSALRVRGNLAQQAQRWAAEGRSADLLLPQGKRLSEAVGLQQSGLFALTDVETQLIAQSGKRVRIREGVRVATMGFIAALAVLATALGITATSAKRAAEQQRTEAEGVMNYMLGDFVDKLRPLGKLDLLDSVSLKALEYLKRPQEEDLSATALTQRAKALQVIGEVRREKGDSKGALDALTTANAILTLQNKAAPGDTEVLKNLGANAFWMGQIARDQNNWQLAGEQWQAYLRYSDRLNKLEPDKVEWWIEQSYAHSNLGALALWSGDASVAAREFQLSIDLKKRAQAKTSNGTPTLEAELANSYSWLASAKESLGELDGAEQLYAQEMETILRLRARAPTDGLWIKRHARALQHRGDIRVALGMDKQALSDYREAEHLSVDILQADHENHTWQSDVASVEQSELRVVARERNDAMVLTKLKELSLTLQNLMKFDSKNVDWARREAVAHRQLASALLAEKEIAEARAENGIALDKLSTLHQENSSNMHVRAELVDALLLSSDIESVSNNAEAAQLSCKKAYAMLKDGALSTNDFQILDPWVRINDCLGNRDLANDAAARLNKIGYRDVAYLHFLSTH